MAQAHEPRHAKIGLRSLSLSYKRKALLYDNDYKIYLIYEDTRVQFYSWCHTKKGLAGMTTTTILRAVLS